LFQIILGPGQSRHGRTGKESWPVTAGDLAEVPERRGKRPCGRLVPGHRAQESPEATLYGPCLALVLVPEDVGRLRDPAIPHPDGGPQRGCIGQTVL